MDPATGIYESVLDGNGTTEIVGPEIEFWEPLTLACFSSLAQTMQCSTLPDWHPYRMQGVGIPNVNRLVINAQLGQNFAGNCCLALSRGLRANAGWNGDAVCGRGRHISLDSISEVSLFATVVKPPQLWVGSSQSSYQIPTWAVERWEENLPAGELAAEAEVAVPLTYHNFESMPGAFVFFVGPERNTKWSRIAGSDGDGNGAGGTTFANSTGEAGGWKDKLRSSRKDKLLSIKQIRLSLNTRSDAFVSTRGNSATFDIMQMYHMTMRNIRKFNLGYTESQMSLTDWYENYCCVIMTVQDLSAAIPSANVRQRVNIHGEILVENKMGYKVNGPAIAACPGFGNAGGAAIAQERYSAMVYSVYNNRAIVLTQSSGEPMTEVLPEAFARELQLGGRAQYVGRV